MKRESAVPNFGLSFRYRLQEKFVSKKRIINLQLSQTPKDYQTEENIVEDEVEAESLLKFRFRTFEEFVEVNEVHSLSSETTSDNLVTKGNVYGTPREDIDEDQISLENVSYVRDVSGNFSNVFCDDEEITEDGNERCSKLDVSQNHRGLAFVERVEENFGEMVVENAGKPHESQFFTDNEDLVSDSDSDSMVCSSISSSRSSFSNSLSDGFLSDIDFESAFEIQTLLEYCFNETNPISDFSAKEDIEYQNLCKDYGSDGLQDEDEEILQELKNLEANLEDKNDNYDTQAQSEQRAEKKVLESDSFVDHNIDLVSKQNNLESDVDDVNDNEGAESVQISEKSSPEEQVCSDTKEQNGSGEWDHQDILEQLKKEIKKVRAIGLATIFEESETPKMLEDLKPWKIEEKNVHEGAMDELHKFYKSYRDRMRKLDILNYQNMYATVGHASRAGTVIQPHPLGRAGTKSTWLPKYNGGGAGTKSTWLPNIIMWIGAVWLESCGCGQGGGFLGLWGPCRRGYVGFLKLKEPLKSSNKNNVSNQAIAAIVSVECWPCKPKSSRDIEQPTMKKYIREIESELERVYVGQMCLSWEFLRWEYVKALELWESDPHGFRHYNDVAEKFQTFQIILTRFLEDEAFQGPRLEHYVKKRCVFRNLLQVPLIRDDNCKILKKKGKVVNEKDVVKSLHLVEIIEESIRILWRFIRADKDTSCTVFVNCRPSANVDLENQADTTLLTRVRSSLQKVCLSLW
ncbi:hypothetical protein KSS87_022570 [Heliosperma pusillum]|nr:hypothetical protein KSS87_022570 [Heliosperma pusillum]